MTQSFPRTTVGGVSMPRMIIGSNWMIGYGHKTASTDTLIRNKFVSAEAVADMLSAFLENGVDAVMCPMNGEQPFTQGIYLAMERTGKKLIVVDTPIINVDDTAQARREAEATIKNSKRLGATFCMPHHSSAEQLVNKNKQTMDRLPDYLSMIRDNGMVPGLSAHMPELIVYSDLNEYDVQTYVQIYNCMGFLMQVEIEYIHSVIMNAKKPVMSIKPMAAGRVTPFVGLTFAYATLRDCDMVTIGCFSREEVVEDIEIARAAIEKRAVHVDGRNSPHKTVIMQNS